MQWNGYEISANVSLLFTELPYMERFEAAFESGFRAVESWWPFTRAHPGDAALDDLVGTIHDSGVRLTGLNFFAGDMAGGERGIACRPERQAELEANTEAVLRVALATGCRGFNLLYGQPDGGAEPSTHRTIAVTAYRRAAEAVEEIGGTVLIEPLAGGLNGTYPLTTHHQGLELADEVGHGSALLLDTFHLSRNGVDPSRAADESAGRIGHVQLADTPDRGEPGSGELDWASLAAALQTSGYSGTVSAEYKPTRKTEETLSWLKN
ncbi:TIM barrel protein [Nesterenkonia xinjiangensis]